MLEIAPVHGEEGSVEREGTELLARVVRPADNKYDLGWIMNGEPGTTGYIFLELESHVEQKVTLGMGADWWMQAWINGEEILNTYAAGNVMYPPCITNYTVDLDLDAGRNMFVVRFSRGRASAEIALGGPGELREKDIWMRAPE